MASSSAPSPFLCLSPCPSSPMRASAASERAVLMQPASLLSSHTLGQATEVAPSIPHVCPACALHTSSRLSLQPLWQTSSPLSSRQGNSAVATRLMMMQGLEPSQMAAKWVILPLDHSLSLFLEQGVSAWGDLSEVHSSQSPSQIKCCFLSGTIRWTSAPRPSPGHCRALCAGSPGKAGLVINLYSHWGVGGRPQRFTFWSLLVFWGSVTFSVGPWVWLWMCKIFLMLKQCGGMSLVEIPDA